ncbi:hypothetical protein GCM10007880_66760 [Mesorhizobium amorphae]|nr:hypothetical protein GCM10007880_66760 [Mesorhizobium amorphae]
MLAFECDQSPRALAMRALPHARNHLHAAPQQKSCGSDVDQGKQVANAQSMRLEFNVRQNWRSGTCYEFRH